MDSAAIIDAIIVCTMCLSYFMGFIAGELLIWHKRIYWSWLAGSLVVLAAG